MNIITSKKEQTVITEKIELIPSESEMNRLLEYINMYHLVELNDSSAIVKCIHEICNTNILDLIKDKGDTTMYVNSSCIVLECRKIVPNISYEE